MTATSADSCLGVRLPYHQEHLRVPFAPAALCHCTYHEGGPSHWPPSEPHAQEQEQCRFAEGMTAAGRR